MPILFERKGFWYLYRFDYKSVGFPYHLYIEFRNKPASSSLSFLKRRLRAFNVEVCSVLEKSSVQKHNIPVYSFAYMKKELKRLKNLEQPLLKFDDSAGAEDIPPY